MLLHNIYPQRLDLSAVILPCLLVIATAFVFLLLRSLKRAYFSLLQSIPGPFFAKFTRIWYLRNVYGGEFETVNARLHEEYGLSTFGICRFVNC